jgi:hypothetical protein
MTQDFMETFVVDTDLLRGIAGLELRVIDPNPNIQTADEVWAEAFSEVASVIGDPFPEVSAKCELKDVCCLELPDEAPSELVYLDEDFDDVFDDEPEPYQPLSKEMIAEVLDRMSKIDWSDEYIKNFRERQKNG